MRQPHVWAIERANEQLPRRLGRVMIGDFRTVYSGTDEAAARRRFADEEINAAHMSEGRYAELKLWHGEELLLHVWHNR